MNFRNAAKIFLTKGGKVLLLKRRPNDPHKPGTWDIPGGRLEPGESPYDGIAREAKEEIGMEVRAELPLDIHHFTRDDGQVITMMIFLCSSETEDVSLSEEHTEFSWVDIGRAPEFAAWLTPVVERYRRIENGSV